MWRNMVFLLWWVLGCSHPDAAVSLEPPASANRGAVASQHGLTYVEHLTGGAEQHETLPLVVAIHGLGDRPEHFAGVFEGWSYKARVVLPAGPTAWGSGHAWMTVRSSEPERLDALAAQTRSSADRVALLIQEISGARPTRGKPVVTGFSQGGMLSYALAVLHGDTIAAAIPVSGFLPRPLYPEFGVSMAPVQGLHGVSDSIISVQWARDTAQHINHVGGRAQLMEYPDVPHTISRPMRVEWFRQLEAATSSGF